MLFIFELMSDQQSERSSEAESLRSLNKARIMSPSSVESTPPTKRDKLKKLSRKDQMKKISIMISDQHKDELKDLLTKSVKKAKQFNKTPESKNSMQNKKGSKSLHKTAQVKNKKGCKVENLCPICLCQYANIRGSLECLHQFCFQCIQKWCQSSTICPCCRLPIASVLKLIREAPQGPIKQTKRISVQQKQLVFQSQYDHYLCYQCGNGDNEHVLLICDQCDFYCCHVYCDRDLNDIIPQGDWLCIYCRNQRRRMPSLSEVIQPAIDYQDSQTQASTFEDTAQNIEKGVFARTRSRNHIDVSSRRRHPANSLRNFRRRVR